MRLSLLHLLKEWKENQLEKVSIILEPGENSWLWGSKEENTLLDLLSMPIIGPLISFLWQGVSESSESQWVMLWINGLVSSNDHIMWL